MGLGLLDQIRARLHRLRHARPHPQVERVLVPRRHSRQRDSRRRRGRAHNGGRLRPMASSNTTYAHPMERERQLTVRDIAELAGVSTATVSRVLNERSDVSPATRQVVLDIVEQHRFRLGHSARGLPRSRTRLVAVTVPLVEGTYFAAMLGGIADALDDAGLKLLLLPTRSDRARPVPLRMRLRPGTAEGAVLMLPPEPLEE